MSKLESEKKDRRVMRLVILSSFLMILYWVNYLITNGLSGILQADLGVMLGKTIIIVLGILAVASLVYAITYIIKYKNEYDRANEMEYILYTISKGKSYLEAEKEYMIGGLTARENLKNEAREWIDGEGLDLYMSERRKRSKTH